MKLTSKDYIEIAEQIEAGTGYVEYEKDNETISFEYEYETEGYVEDDYYNGTGAFIETSRELYVTNIESWDEEGDETENDFDQDKLIGWVA